MNALINANPFSGRFEMQVEGVVWEPAGFPRISYPAT
jgi:hypothetical protein